MKNRNVPFFDYARHWTDHRKSLIKIIDQVSSKGAFIMQEELNNFEMKLSKYLGSKYAIGVANATDAMEIFLQALNLNESDEIIISTHTMIATASAIKFAGAKPIPVDIGPDFMIDPDSIENAITKNTVGIMPTQLNGRTCDMDKIQKIASKRGLFIVEDAAQSLGSKYKNKNAGTFGLASDFSFYPAKVLGSIGDAGVIITNDENLYLKTYQIHDHGRDKNDGEIKIWGRNSRLDNIQAAILLYKLDNYENVIKRRREIASIYNERLSSLDEIRLPPGPNSSIDHFDVYQNYELLAKDRNQLRLFLKDHGIGTLIQWGGKAIHHYDILGFNQVCQYADTFFKECLMLPINTFVSDDDVHYVCDKIYSFYRS